MKLTHSTLRKMGYRKRRGADFFYKSRITRCGGSKTIIQARQIGSRYEVNAMEFERHVGSGYHGLEFSECATVGDMRSWEKFAFVK